MMATIGEFLTDKQIKACRKLYQTAAPGTFARHCAETIIEPDMARINAKLGQKNDARFLAYFVEFWFMKGR